MGKEAVRLFCHYFIFPASSTPPAAYTQIIYNFNDTFVKSTNGRNFGNLKQSNIISDIWKYLPGTFFHIIFSLSLDQTGVDSWFKYL
jgi:hypothetical protein